MEYKFITQETVDKGILNVTSADMYKEGQKYNELMIKMRKKKSRTDIAFGNWCLIQFGILFLCFYWLNVSDDKLEFWPAYKNISLGLYVFLFFFFVVYKKDRRPLTAFLISLPLPVFLFRLIGITAANVILAHMYTKFYNQAQTELGYPKFASLKITYIHE